MSLTDFKAKINKYNVRSIIIIKQRQNMNLMLNMKDISKDTLQMQKKSKKKHFCENMSPCHAFTSPSSSKTTKE